jgi:hypothetical protein
MGRACRLARTPFFGPNTPRFGPSRNRTKSSPLVHKTVTRIFRVLRAVCALRRRYPQPARMAQEVRIGESAPIGRIESTSGDFQNVNRWTTSSPNSRVLSSPLIDNARKSPIPAPLTRLAAPDTLPELWSRPARGYLRVPVERTSRYAWARVLAPLFQQDEDV